MNRDHLLHEILPYRIQAVSVLNLALRYRMKWDDPPPIRIFINDELAVEGNLNAFTNPAIEAGLVHCRALLEFLGLRVSRSHTLVNIEMQKRRSGDVGIENFENANGHLPMVKPAEALGRYGGDPAEAERALVAVFQITNKGVAHVTEDLVDNPEHGNLIEIASRGVPSLVINYLYTPLGLPAPVYKLSSRLYGS